MKSIDIRFTDQMVAILQSMVGRKFLRYNKSDPFDDTPSSFGIVGIITEDNSYAFTNTIEVLDYYGADEDVAVFRLEERPEDQIESLLQDTKMNKIPINRIIKEIHIVNEHQKLFEGEEQTYDVWVTRGVIFIMDDGLEVSFEKNVWFSEMITVDRGENLYERFDPTSEFTEDWEAPEHAECERSMIILKH